MKFASALALSLAAGGGVALAQATLSPADLLAHGAQYDGKSVTVAGTVAHIVHKTSHRGNAYTTFDLCSSTSCIHVFEYGNVTVTAGATTTQTGMYSVEKHVGTDVYHNELDVEGPGD